ncbi:hypothetical protein [Dysosmobacter sp.]|uniref:hypothetical protein n=1 Tax=Dysosmobacter sp. TaxID=2591382 RepID=UPI002A8D5215|nr:hypothetical protein [Dysosmobacter sp.]MDY3281719.1 hypothetical protein [Dysosmobacter sp.]
MKQWFQAIDQIREEKFGDTEDMRYDGWRRQNRSRLNFLVLIAVFALLLLLLSVFFPDAVSLF